MYHFPTPVRTVLEKLQSENIEAYLVGGCVRDLLLGHAPHDYDITVNCSPEQIISMFEHVIPTGIAHGTVTVLQDDMPIEITQMRSDGDYIDHRHPVSVTPTTSLAEDLKRRDFTVNAMTMDINGNITDLFGGISDLKNKKIVAVGQPSVRYNEDALRILRCFRFASQLEFDIEEETLSSALNLAHLLPSVSVERIYHELGLLLCGKNPAVIQPLILSGGLSHYGLGRCNSLEILNTAPNNKALRLYLLIDCCNASPAVVLEKLRVEKKIRKDVLWYTQNKHRLSDDKISLKQLLRTATPELLFNLIKVFGNDTQLSLLDEIVRNNEPYNISDLAVGGDDLINKGFSGKQISAVLNALLDFVIEYPQNNQRDILLNKTDCIKGEDDI